MVFIRWNLIQPNPHPDWREIRQDCRTSSLALAVAERSNLLHVLSIKIEVEEVQILFHAFLMNSLRDDDYVALQQPAQGYLYSSLAVFLANLGEGWVGSGST